MDEQTGQLSPDENRKVFTRGLNRTLGSLADADVFIIEDVPEVGSKYGKDVANHFLRMAWLTGKLGQYLYFELPMDPYDESLEAVLASAKYPYHWVEVKPRLCAEGRCPLMEDGILLYRDGDHLSSEGAIRLSPIFESLVSPGADSPAVSFEAVRQ